MPRRYVEPDDQDFINPQLDKKIEVFRKTYGAKYIGNGMQKFIEFITGELPDNIEKMMYWMMNSFEISEIISLIRKIKVKQSVIDHIIENMDQYKKDHDAIKLEYNKDIPYVSITTIDSLQINGEHEHVALSDFISKLNNLDSNMNTTNIYNFIYDRKDTQFFNEYIGTIIKKMYMCIRSTTSIINIKDIVAIKQIAVSKQIKELDQAMNAIINQMLDYIFDICSKIEQAKPDTILLTRLKIENNESETLDVIWYDKKIENIDIENIDLSTLNTKINKIETEFILENGIEYTLGRFSRSKVTHKIPVFSSTHPHIECTNHAKVAVNEQDVTIQNVLNGVHNGTFILRGDVTIKLPKDGKTPYRLFNNDIIRIGENMILNKWRSTNIQCEEETQNDAKYKLYIPKPKTIILNGFIKCSVEDAKSLMDNKNGGEKIKYCIHENGQYFKNPNSQGGGPAYITIAGRRRKIHIQKGKQYVNYKSELILVSKLKKLIK